MGVFHFEKVWRGSDGLWKWSGSLCKTQKDFWHWNCPNLGSGKDSQFIVGDRELVVDSKIKRSESVSGLEAHWNYGAESGGWKSFSIVVGFAFVYQVHEYGWVAWFAYLCFCVLVRGQGIYRNTATMVRFLFLEVWAYQLVWGDSFGVTADARKRDERSHSVNVRVESEWESRLLLEWSKFRLPLGVTGVQGC